MSEDVFQIEVESPCHFGIVLNREFGEIGFWLSRDWSCQWFGTRIGCWCIGSFAPGIVSEVMRAVVRTVEPEIPGLDIRTEPAISCAGLEGSRCWKMRPHSGVDVDYIAGAVPGTFSGDRYC